MAATPEIQCVDISNLGVKLETVMGVTYPHHIFGSQMVLVDDKDGSLLLPGVNGEVNRVLIAMVEPSTHLVYAIADYAMPEKGFLSLRAEDVLLVTEADASGWWLGINQRGKKGVFPSTYTVPHLFPEPTELIVDQLKLIKLAGSFGIDLTTGVPHVSIGPPQLQPTNGTVMPITTVETAYKVMNDCIVEREVQRRSLLDALKFLLAEEKNLESIQQDDRKAASSSSSQRVSSDPSPKTVDEGFAAIIGTIEATKSKLISEGHGAIPASRWYKQYASLLRDAEMDGVSTLAQESELLDAKAAVQRMEAVLNAAATKVKTDEEQYLQQRSVLMDRIGVRDALVSEMLRSWAARAEEAKAEYLRTKAQHQCLQLEQEREEKVLTAAIEAGKARYLSVSAQLQEVRASVKETRSQLSRRKELETMEGLIDQLNADIINYRKAYKSSL